MKQHQDYIDKINILKSENINLRSQVRELKIIINDLQEETELANNHAEHSEEKYQYYKKAYQEMKPKYDKLAQKKTLIQRIFNYKK